MNISVIIPTYNRRQLIGRAIESVLAQTYQPAEIIVVDDGSTDGTSEWINDNFPKLRAIQLCGGFEPSQRQSNQGVSAARNTGINMAAFDWIAFLDSDDEWLPDKLEKQVEALKMNPDYQFCHSNEIWIRNGVEVKQKKSHQKFGGSIFDESLDKCRISPSTVLMHKSILSSIGLFDVTLTVCEDYDLWLRITAQFPILFVETPLIKKYGGHGDQLSKINDGIEVHHIHVLEKLIQLNFSPTQKESMKKMLIQKLSIYAKGAKKRGKSNDYSQSMKRIDELSIVV